LTQLFRAGAFHGTTGTEAYFAKHDATTRTDIDHGRVSVEIGFALLKPAEFILLRLVQKPPPPPLPDDPACFDARAESPRACRPLVRSLS
jgi:hypothetical protein